MKHSKSILRLSRALVVILLIVGLVACVAQTVFSVAAAAGLAAAAALNPTDPSTAQQITAVVNDFTTFSNLVASYQKASATARRGIAGNIESAGTALQANLGALLATVKVKDSSLVELIEVFVAAGNAAIVAGLNQIPATAGTTAVTASASNATTSVKPSSMTSGAAVKKMWNERAQVRLPGAVLK
jgi:hypothetical protein